jgi:RimJ/RimL family protein N-acetyltransferase
MGDIDKIVAAYSDARQYMAASNNPQWSDGHPRRELAEADIKNALSYVCVRDNDVVGVFAFILGTDTTYLEIRGQWLNDEPYATIHRIAKRNGVGKGVFDECVAFCKTQIDNLRIDTHEDNATMRHLLVKFGFQYCGIIKLANGEDRLAYQWVKC